VCSEASPYALKSITGNSSDDITYSYNSLGQRLGQNQGQQIKWGLADKPTKITTPNGTETIAYGLQQKRYLRVNADNNKIFYVGDVEYQIEKNGKTRTCYYIRNGEYSPIAQVRKDSENATYTYYLRDHQGTPLRTVNNSGVAQTLARYNPWGQSTLANGVKIEQQERHRAFSGHENIASAELTDMNARLYDAFTGEFLSPDPLIEIPANLPNLNRYSYVNNSPPNWTDTTGKSRFTGTGAVGRWLFDGASKALMEGATATREEFIKMLNHPVADRSQNIEDHFRIFHIPEPSRMYSDEIEDIKNALRKDGAVIINTDGFAFHDEGLHSYYLYELVDSIEQVHQTGRFTSQFYDINDFPASFRTSWIPHIDKDTRYTLLTNVKGHGTLLSMGATAEQRAAIRAFKDRSKMSLALDHVKHINDTRFVELPEGLSAFFPGEAHESLPGFIHASPTTSQRRIFYGGVALRPGK